MSDWQKLRFGDHIYLKGRIGWKGLKRSEFSDTGDFIIINGPNFYNKRVDWDSCKYISKERYDESEEIQIKLNDILITKDGTIGKIAYIDKLPKPASVASGIFVIRNIKPEIFDTKFIYYFLLSSYFSRFVKLRTEGSVIPHLYQRDFYEMEINCPPLHTQKRIADILSALDDKIENNRRTTQTLEQIAQTIFKHWFIDFEFPNQQGLPYKSSGGKVVWNEEVGKEIPEGWIVDIMENALSHIIDYRGKTPKKSEAGIPTLSAKSVKNNFIDYSKAYFISEKTYNDFMVRGIPKKGDILLTTEAPLGKVAKLNKDGIGIAQRLLTLRGKENYLDNNYLLHFLQSKEGQHQLISKKTGTTVTGIKQKDFRKCYVLIPPYLKQKKFINLISSFNNEIENNEKKTDNLEQLRDALLPKLMSGEIEL